MQNHAPEGGVAIMPMRVPAAGADIHLNIPAHGRLLAELDNGAAKIGPARHISEAGVKNPRRRAV
jgi:hypothetical protein